MTTKRTTLNPVSSYDLPKMRRDLIRLLPMFEDWEVESFQDIAKEYTKNYKVYIEKEYGLELESLAFESLSIPREYNFTTDRIFCHISQNDILKLYAWNRTTGRLTQELINQTFKSRDGFHSFY